VGLLTLAPTSKLNVTVGGVTGNDVQFSLSGGPAITGISPTSGAYNSPVTISGSGFGSTQSNSTAAFYGISATTITSWSDTQIVANFPVGTGSGPVSVTVAGITAWGPNFTLTRNAVLTNSRGDTTTIVFWGLDKLCCIVPPEHSNASEQAGIHP
jgi:IPT/TIG domain